MTIQEFADRVQAEQVARFRRDYPNLDPLNEYNGLVSVKPGPKYTKVDVGRSGKYMVVNATGEIYGTKAYGVIHRGHFYGTLETVDSWYWGEYSAVRKPVASNAS